MAGTLAIQLRNLKVFCDVIERRSFSLAAADNGLTQSAVSQCVQQLEDILGARLVDRSKRPPLPTAEGQRFYEGCGKLLRQYETLVEEVQSLGQELSGRIKIASIYSVGLSYLPPLRERFQAMHPKVELSFQFEQPDEVYRLVERGAADLGLVSYPYSNKTMVTQHWRDEPMMLVASARSRFAQLNVVDAEQLGKLPMVAFLPHLRIRQEIDRRMRSLGVVPKVVAELDNIDSVKHAVSVNTGVAFVPEPTVRTELASGQLVGLACPLIEMNRPLGIIHRRSATLGASARCFLEFLLRDVQGKEQAIESQKDVSGNSVGATELAAVSSGADDQSLS